MSERAYSFELNENITAKKAVELSEMNKLRDERAFRCSDQKCRISLTCTNWNNTNGKRFYFVPSHNDELHVIGCDEVGKKEEQLQIEKEKKDITKEINSNGIITMMVSPDKNTKEVVDIFDSKSIISENKEYQYKKQNKYQGERYENRRAARIEAFVELFNNDSIDKDREVIYVKGKMYSLNQLFISCDERLECNHFGIFYGKSLLKKCTFNSAMIEISFVDSTFPKIYTNIDSLKKISNGSEIKNYIDTDKCVITYFRGNYNLESNKFVSYNDKYYKDLYFQIE